MASRVGGGVVKAMEGSVVDSGVVSLSWRFLGVLGRGRAKVFVVCYRVCWAFGGKLGIG